MIGYAVLSASIALNATTVRALDPAMGECVTSDEGSLQPSVPNPYHPHAELRSAEFQAANAEYLAAVAQTEVEAARVDRPVNPYFPDADPKDPVFQTAMQAYLDAEAARQALEQSANAEHVADPYHPAADPKDPAYRATVEEYVAALESEEKDLVASRHPYHPLADTSDPAYQEALAAHVALMAQTASIDPCTGAALPPPANDSPNP